MGDMAQLFPAPGGYAQATTCELIRNRQRKSRVRVAPVSTVLATEAPGTAYRIAHALTLASTNPKRAGATFSLSSGLRTWSAIWRQYSAFRRGFVSFLDRN